MPEYLDIPQVAEMFGVNPRTVYKWTVERKIPFFKLNKMIRFSRTEIEAWLEQHHHRVIDETTLAERTDVRLDH